MNRKAMLNTILGILIGAVLITIVVIIGGYISKPSDNPPVIPGDSSDLEYDSIKNLVKDNSDKDIIITGRDNVNGGGGSSEGGSSSGGSSTGIESTGETIVPSWGNREIQTGSYDENEAPILPSPKSTSFISIIVLIALIVLIILILCMIKKEKRNLKNTKKKKTKKK